MKTTTVNRPRWYVRHWLLISSLGCLPAIPFACAQPLLRATTPILLDDTVNILDQVVWLLAPILLP